MRNRAKTIESLRRLAERPGTKHEGETARKMLDQMLHNTPTAKPFNSKDFPKGTKVFYNMWAYPTNNPCTVLAGRLGTLTQIHAGQVWMRLRFKHLKQPRWVPVTSAKGCHISKEPLSEQDAAYLYGP